MKIILVLISVLALSFANFSFADEEKTCGDCTLENKCEVTVPIEGECNTATFETWCIDDAWFTDGIPVDRTKNVCWPPFQVPNPYTE